MLKRSNSWWGILCAHAYVSACIYCNLNVQDKSLFWTNRIGNMEGYWLGQIQPLFKNSRSIIISIFFAWILHACLKTGLSLKPNCSSIENCSGGSHDGNLAFYSTTKCWNRFRAKSNQFFVVLLTVFYSLALVQAEKGERRETGNVMSGSGYLFL